MLLIYFVHVNILMMGVTDFWTSSKLFLFWSKLGRLGFRFKLWLIGFL